MIYENIVSYCKENGISISAFEKKCGIGNGTIGGWKDDISKPSLATLEKIAKETEIPIAKWLEIRKEGDNKCSIRR